jgi:hypothetical protein
MGWAFAAKKHPPKKRKTNHHLSSVCADQLDLSANGLVEVM